MGKAKKRISIAILVIVVLLALFASLIGFISDFLWFKEMGYLSVFFKQLVTQLTVGIPTLIIITGLVYLYLTKLRKGYFAKIASSEETNLKKLKITTLILSIVFGIFATVMTVMQLWFEILKFSNSTSFGIDDPLFGLDISFYIFRLDFLTQLNEILIGVIMGFIILTVIYYIILMAVRTPDVFRENVPPGAEYAGAEGEAFSGSDRYTGESNPFERGNKRTAGGNDFFGKFAEAFMGKKPQAKQSLWSTRKVRPNLLKVRHICCR